MATEMKMWRNVLSVVLCACSLIYAGCHQSRRGEESDRMSKRGINVVKEAHEAEFLALRGVVGVYIGQTDTGDSCIYVMIAKKNPDLERRIPASLEGYPVRVQETGEIRPMQQNDSG